MSKMPARTKAPKGSIPGNTTTKITGSRVAKHRDAPRKATASDRSASKRYSEADTARIVKMRKEGIPWKEVAQAFPERSIDGLRSHLKLVQDPEMYKTINTHEGLNGDTKKYPLLPHRQAKSYILLLASWEHERQQAGYYAAAQYAHSLAALAESLSQRRLNRLAVEYHNACIRSHNDLKCIQIITSFASTQSSGAEGANSEDEESGDEATLSDASDTQPEEASTSSSETDTDGTEEFDDE